MKGVRSLLFIMLTFTLALHAPPENYETIANAFNEIYEILPPPIANHIFLEEEESAIKKAIQEELDARWPYINNQLDSITETFPTFVATVNIAHQELSEIIQLPGIYKELPDDAAQAAATRDFRNARLQLGIETAKHFLEPLHILHNHIQGDPLTKEELENPLATNLVTEYKNQEESLIKKSLTHTQYVEACKTLPDMSDSVRNQILSTLLMRLKDRTFYTPDEKMMEMGNTIKRDTVDIRYLPVRGQEGGLCGFHSQMYIPTIEGFSQDVLLRKLDQEYTQDVADGGRGWFLPSARANALFMQFLEKRQKSLTTAHVPQHDKIAAEAYQSIAAHLAKGEIEEATQRREQAVQDLIEPTIEGSSIKHDIAFTLELIKNKNMRKKSKIFLLQIETSADDGQIYTLPDPSESEEFIKALNGLHSGALNRIFLLTRIYTEYNNEEQGHGILIALVRDHKSGKMRVVWLNSNHDPIADRILSIPRIEKDIGLLAHHGIPDEYAKEAEPQVWAYEKILGMVYDWAQYAQNPGKWIKDHRHEIMTSIKNHLDPQISKLYRQCAEDLGFELIENPLANSSDPNTHDG